MTVHQGALFFNNPRLFHKCAVRRITNYLARMSTHMDLPDGNRWLSPRGTVYKPDKEKSVDCYVDTEFSSGWDQYDAGDAENFMSRTGCVITYAGCPILWCSKLQT